MHLCVCYKAKFVFFLSCLLIKSHALEEVFFHTFPFDLGVANSTLIFITDWAGPWDLDPDSAARPPKSDMHNYACAHFLTVGFHKGCKTIRIQYLWTMTFFRIVVLVLITAVNTDLCAGKGLIMNIIIAIILFAHSCLLATDMRQSSVIARTNNYSKFICVR